MIYLLLIFFPIVTAAGSFLLRRDNLLVTWIGAAALAAELSIAVSTPIDQPAQLLQVSISYTELSRLLLATFCIGALAATLAGTARPHGEYFVATLLLIMGLAAAMLIVQEPFVVASLLLLAGLIGGLQLVDQPVDSEQLLKAQTIRMALKYMLLVALGGVLLLIGFVLATAFTQQLAETGPILFRAIFGLLLIGFSLRVALLPFHVWLPDLASPACCAANTATAACRQ
jgi:formate hydrogenlyase subunit 3/multisubunit Na+/H+ antiporter MnhD subunit